jgi:hypothetical protein
MSKEMPIDTGLVQNRLTIAGFILALLVFVSSALLAFIALTAQAQIQAGKAESIASAPWIYLNTVIPVLLGFLFSIASIVSLLQSQATGKPWLYNFGEILLYLSLSQFLSSGLNNIVNILANAIHNQATTSRPIASFMLSVLVRGLPLLLWWLLLFGAPLNIIHRIPDKRKVSIGYIVALTIIFLTSALSYSIKEDANAGFFTFIKWCIYQPFQPYFW